MSYSREQIAQFRAAFASLAVVGPEWKLPVIPDWRTPKPMKPKSNLRRGENALTVFGKTMNIRDWAKERNMKEATLSNRLRHGFTLERALTEPIRVHRMRVRG